jgi:hypothetical protein
MRRRIISHKASYVFRDDNNNKMNLIIPIQRKCLLIIVIFLCVSFPAIVLCSPYQQGADGIVSIESENFDLNISQGTHDWVQFFPSGYSGTAAMEAQPNTGTNNNTGYESSSPRLDFEVNFVYTGTHYVWIRGIGASGTDDSVHVGLDGAALASSDRITSVSSSTDWVWTQDTMDGVVATVDVATSGVHTLNVWMREDGFVIDKIVLTTSASFIPTGTGPTESPRGNSDDELLNPGDDGYEGSFLANMQGIIDAVISSGKMPFLAKVPIALGPCSTCTPFSDPEAAPRNALIRDYNTVIDALAEANGLGIAPIDPDFYAYFSANQDEFTDNLHPDGVGYQSMADLWFNALLP